MCLVKRNRMCNLGWVIFPFLLLACVACNRVAIPKPYGYFRITPPDTAYTDFQSAITNHQSAITNHQSPITNYPYTFALSRNAVVQPRTDQDEPYWINLYYPALDATIHCSYKPLHGNLRALTNDALELVYHNASHASAIPERDYSRPADRVYGVLFDLEGNTASSCQFFLTDSVRHFFRASVYCNCQPNADSLAPVYNYLRMDVIKMIETFRWQ